MTDKEEDPDRRSLHEKLYQFLTKLKPGKPIDDDRPKE